jgi:hypothetical protein
MGATSQHHTYNIHIEIRVAIYRTLTTRFKYENCGQILDTKRRGSRKSGQIKKLEELVHDKKSKTN